MKSSDKILSNIFEEWPLLKHPYGYKLIKYDFDQMRLTNFYLTSKKWNKFFNTIKENVQFTNKNNDFPDLIETLNLDISKDSKLAITIQLLSYMIPPKQNIKDTVTKKGCKASIALSRDSMIKYINTWADITKIRQEARDKTKKMQISVQPYVIVVGSITNVSDSYVIIDEVLYSTESTLEALDICFKVFHVLKIDYPDASKHLWMLIQKGLYQFCIEWDISFSNTEHVLKKLMLNKCKPKTASM
ncbi:hypothetical protein ALC57_11798 [Trachymyrmex cornetzi]|uniref:Uncharacterized protein n=1 Tax=Trachymyrmex cornetzi TaxID=471704 RepID=A0A151J1U9_9HYME|nr:hypothetical protein ALC57_11798 [Trachymyrmex cornetzi]